MEKLIRPGRLAVMVIVTLALMLGSSFDVAVATT